MANRESVEEATTAANNLLEPNESYNENDAEITESFSLRRNVGVLGGVAFLVGTIIGSGIFATPKWVLMYTGSVGLNIVVWALCGAISLLGALCYVELGLTIPKSGAEYAYLMEAFGPLPAFLYSWIYVLFVRPTGVMILLVFASYVLEPFFPGCSNQAELIPLRKLLAASALGVITFVNCASVKWATRMQVVFTVAKMVAIGMLVITGIVRLAQGYTMHFENSFSGTTTNIGLVGFAFYNGLYSYDGWNQLNFFTEELRKPSRDLPVSIFIGLPLVTICYVLVNITYLTVLSPQELLDSGAVAVTLANRLYGGAAWIIPILVACSTFGSANGNAFAGGRLVFAAARQGHLPQILAMIHTKRRTPLPALLFTAIISSLMIIPDTTTFETLLNYFSFVAWIFYGVTMFTVIWLRIRKPNVNRPFKAWFIIPAAIVMVLVAIYLVVAPFSQAPLESIYSLLFILTGIPVYFLLVRHKHVVPQWYWSAVDCVTLRLQTVLDVALPDREPVNQ